MARKGGLGKGFGSLFEDNNLNIVGTSETLPVTELTPNRNQPRKEFDRQSLAELAASITELGVIQPILVRRLPGGEHQIVAGERRWRAAQLAGLTSVPVVIRSLTEQEVDEIALVENLQREDLNPIEEAEGYDRLMRNYDMTQEIVSQRVGKSRSAVANAVRLLSLPEAVKQMLSKGDLTVGHARPLLSLSDKSEISRIASLVSERGLTVRDVERLIKKEKDKGKDKTNLPEGYERGVATGGAGGSVGAGGAGSTAPAAEMTAPYGAGQGSSAKPAAQNENDRYIEELELAMREELRRYIKITGGKNGRGRIEIEFFSLEELVDIAMRVAGNK
ncbi:MAG: ParB/RepB/Spo0J family partition protein [Oscillospiraceae bacterium]|jgi:ParB family chromosome partitioning protein|nr:ParB/RepB/Spo0J family partition protein [Oscillospiraceae bacterium]